MPIYLDNAAAAPCDPELLEYFRECALQFPGNQESMGFHGSAAARKIREASDRLTSVLPGYTPFFANTGTEVLAIAAEAACRIGKHGEVITTSLEHPAMEFALKRSCERHGMKLRICPAGKNGVDLHEFENLLSDQTAIAAVHHVQSETGGILDLSAVRTLLNRKAPKALLLADTMQSFGKIPLDIPERKPDFFTLSGQKLGAPCGAVLFCSDRYAKAVRALRSAEHFGGRCPVPVLLTLLSCALLTLHQQPENLAHAGKLRAILLDELKKNGLDFPVTLSGNAVSPFILHLLTAPYQGAILTRSLLLDEISVAPGSACESETPGGSRALTAMGYSPKESFCGLRISLWKDNTPEEMRIFAEKLALCIKKY